MKKALCFLLAAVMAFAALPLTAAADEAPLDEYSVTANATIGLNLYIDLNPAVRDTQTVTISYTNEALEEVSNTYNVADLTPYRSEGNHTQYAFTIVTAPALIGNPVTVSFDDGIASLETSIVNYTHAVIPSTEDDNLRVLATALECYGCSSQMFFNQGVAFNPLYINTENVVGHKTVYMYAYTVIFESLKDYYQLPDDIVTDDIDTSNIVYFNYRGWHEEGWEATGYEPNYMIYMAKANPEFRVYYSSIDEEQAVLYNEQGITVTGIDGVSARFMKDENENIFLEVTGISVEDTLDFITASFGEGSNSVTFSPFGVLWTVIKRYPFNSQQESEDCEEFFHVLYHYFKAAIGYFNS